MFSHTKYTCFQHGGYLKWYSENLNQAFKVKFKCLRNSYTYESPKMQFCRHVNSHSLCKLRTEAEDGNNKLQQEVWSSWHFNVHPCQKIKQHIMYTVNLQSSVTCNSRTFQVIVVRYFWWGLFFHGAMLHVHRDFFNKFSAQNFVMYLWRQTLPFECQ